MLCCVVVIFLDPDTPGSLGNAGDLLLAVPDKVSFVAAAAAAAAALL